MKINTTFLILFCLFGFCRIAGQITYKDNFPNISFQFPVELSTPNDGSDRMFVVEQPGVIKVFPLIENVNSSQINTFLDIKDRVYFSSGQEIGLLGLAFHPNYTENGYFYVYYTTNSPVSGISTRMVLSRFKVSSSNPNIADVNSETILFEYDKNQNNSNHNGGKIAFGPDSFLYISFGDGGGGGDPKNNAQNINNVFGTICRIDVDLDGNNPKSVNGNYEIPNDNPYVGRSGLDEIYAIGLRNTWKFSFDFETNRLWGADVGQGSFEEVNLITKGMNLGWSRYEANTIVDNNIEISDEVTFPIYFYNHSQGDVSITGGYVYRGSSISSVSPSIHGKYIYGDYVSGRVWALTYNETTGEATNELLFRANGKDISSFGRDRNNEIYFSEYGSSSKIYKIVDGSSNNSAKVVSGYGNWENIGGGIKNGIVNGLTSLPNKNIFIAGSFNAAANNDYPANIALWNETNGWLDIGTGTNGVVYAITSDDNGNVYIGGSFTQVNGVNAKNIAVYNGSQWSPLGNGVDGVVYAIEPYNNGVYVGGIFSKINSVTANNIAYFNGVWNVLSGVNDVGTNNEVRSLEIDTDGMLYVGGNFDTAGGVSANRIATWNGSSWGTLGTGTSGFVEAIVATNTDVFLGGNFAIAGGETVNRIARWSKSESKFYALDKGLSNNVSSLIHNGSYLVAGGSFEIAFNNAENIIVNRIARWRTTGGWEAMGTSTSVGVNIKVNSLIFSPTNNEKVYTGGSFTSSGAISAENLSLWSSENVLSVDNLTKEETYIFPNPSKTIVNISKKNNWELFDNLGRIIEKGSKSFVEINNLANGIYFLKIHNGKTFKIIKY